MNFDKKWTFLDHLPTLSCKRSLWTAPNHSCQRSLLQQGSANQMHYLQFSNWDGNIAWLRENVDDWSSINDAFILSEIIKTHLLIILDLPAVKKDTNFGAARKILGTSYFVTDLVHKIICQDNESKFKQWSICERDLNSVYYGWAPIMKYGYCLTRYNRYWVPSILGTNRIKH